MNKDNELRVVINGQDNTKGAFNSVNRSLQVLGSLLTFTKLKQGMDSVIDASKTMQNSMIGLSSVANHLGVEQRTATSSAQGLARDGLMSVRESAEGLKNLLATGFSMPQAINLMNTFKDSAAFNRQGTLGFGEAIVGATQGLKNQNSIMVDNVGITKNLSNILKEQGLSVNELGNVTSDASVRQKLYNGLMKEGSLFSGDAAKASKTLSGQQAQLSTTIFNLKSRIGDIIGAGYTPLLTRMNEFLGKNQQVVASIVIASATALAFGSAIIAVVGAIRMAITIMSGPFAILLLLVSALLGEVVFKAMQRVQEQFMATAEDFNKGSEDMKNSAQDNLVDGVGGSASKLSQELKKIDEQIKLSQRTFRESLTKMVQDHQAKVNDIKKQQLDENTSYDEQLKEKKDGFGEETDAYKEESDDRLKKYNDAVSAEQAKGRMASSIVLGELKRRFDDEQKATDDSYAKKSQSYEKDTAKITEEHVKKSAELQTQLDTETAFLMKHNDDVKSIRDVQLLDEIDHLKRGHTEELAAFEEQKRAAIKSAGETASGISSAYNNIPNQIDTTKIGNVLGAGLTGALKSAFLQGINDVADILGENLLLFGRAIKDFSKDGGFNPFGIGNKTGGKGIKDYMSQAANELFGTSAPGRASGGPVYSGRPYIINENGPEMFVPDSAGTIIPTDKLMGMGGSQPINVYQTNHNYTTNDVSAAARQLGFELKMRLV